MASTASPHGGVDGVGGAHLLRRLKLAVVDVDRDDLRRSGQPGSGDRRVADAAAADDGDRVAAADLTGVDGGADARHDTAAEESGDLGGDLRVDLGALAGGDEGLLGEGADAEGGRQLRAVQQRHLLLGVVGVEAVPGSAAQTCAALAAHGTPVEDDEVAGGDVRDALADRLHDARGLVAEEEGELVVDAALLVVQVGVADAARLDLHDGLAGAGVRDHDRLDPDRLVLARCDDRLHLLCHNPALPAPALREDRSRTTVRLGRPPTERGRPVRAGRRPRSPW